MSLRARKSKTISFTARSEYRSATTTIKIAILDDYVNIALRSADWSVLQSKARDEEIEIGQIEIVNHGCARTRLPCGGRSRS